MPRTGDPGLEERLEAEALPFGRTDAEGVSEVDVLLQVDLAYS